MDEGSIKEFFKRLNTADEKPAEECVDEEEHEYVAVSHSDAKDHYAWYLECTKCKHMMVQKFERDEEDKKIWT